MLIVFCRRTMSPERMACPLLPGTPETPPPRVPQPWELKKRSMLYSEFLLHYSCNKKKHSIYYDIFVLEIVPPGSGGPTRCPDDEPGLLATNGLLHLILLC